MHQVKKNGFGFARGYRASALANPSGEDASDDFGASTYLVFCSTKAASSDRFRMEEVVLVLKEREVERENLRLGIRVFNDWAPIDEIAELQEFVNMIKLQSTDHLGQRRRAKRFPFMATVRFSSPDVVDLAACSIGVCMDISEGGLKILSESIPGEIGTPLVVRVNPAGQTKLPAFQSRCASCGAFRLHHAGFSVKFIDLDPAMKAILKKAHPLLIFVYSRLTILVMLRCTSTNR